MEEEEVQFYADLHKSKHTLDKSPVFLDRKASDKA